MSRRFHRSKFSLHLPRNQTPRRNSIFNVIISPENWKEKSNEKNNPLPVCTHVDWNCPILREEKPKNRLVCKNLVMDVARSQPRSQAQAGNEVGTLPEMACIKYFSSDHVSVIILVLIGAFHISWTSITQRSLWKSPKIIWCLQTLTDLRIFLKHFYDFWIFMKALNHFIVGDSTRSSQQ